MRCRASGSGPELSRARLIEPLGAGGGGLRLPPAHEPDEAALSQARETITDEAKAEMDKRQPLAGPRAARSDGAALRDVEPTAPRSEEIKKAPAKPGPQGKPADSKPKISLLSTVRRHALAASLIAAAALICAVAVVIWWLNARNFESTDDAFIDARTVSISSQINGAIVEVPVNDNQQVETGAPLARIDDRDYRAALDQAKAQVDQATAGIANLDAQIEAQQARIEQAQKQVSEAQAALTFAQQEDARAQTLLQRGAGTQQQAQQTSSTLRQDQAALDAAQANQVAAQKQIAVLQTQRKVADGQLEQANAAKEQADTNLSRTVITAPTAGRVTKLTAAKGAYAQPGQSLMMFVPRDVWVTANFKETQLAEMRPGQGVDIEVDAYPNHPLHGHIDSIQGGSGAAFSLLPPENATGNYVKVVQRVPVKIVFDNPPDVLLGPGMSVVPSVKVR
jgi:membrane fusion protein (multidrug efflux system)